MSWRKFVIEGLLPRLVTQQLPTSYPEVLPLNAQVAAALRCTAGWLKKTCLTLQIEGSRRNIEEHYDAGNAMYKLFLDETMTYSSGIHRQGTIHPLTAAYLANSASILSRMSNR